ncbi:hypothetical protein [Streptomyces sp. NBC_01198]|uniref:hypothetical protein n=1 Tax=Streptomyces sp. NBC_01198 TaxID=2903769 RepID=UPI002E0D9E06|nr:hypothetical protein OG702_15880 [Streptomyces sp. NBC_01198]
MTAYTLLTFTADQLVQWRYGTAGALALTLAGVGHKIRNTTFTALGLTALALLLAQ